ncbi:DNA repair protein XRCC4-like [Dendronephthya gigantea]|uniref:DNA repair protein XRCC4-like n=1 Tax=Dendronephthya gigantea TaxID=151771 RepID=UPI00106B2658|nr:DNA repair protein XRCC4-like [Dendronephthya gigantea]
MEEEENLCKVETNDGDLYLLIRQNEIGFDLVVTDGCTIWDTTVTEDLLQEMAGKVEMSSQDYTRQTINALTANSSETETFIYQAVKNEGTLEFSWKKQLDYGVKFQLGSVTLNSSKDSTVLMKKILDFAIKKVYNYKDTIANMQCEMDQLARDRESAISRLDKCIVGKEEMEVDLFQKFVTVLNDKKAKIRRLQETIQQQSTEPNPTVKSTADLIEDDVTADKNRDGDTDIEMEDSQNKDAVKDTAKKATTSNIGSDLFQDEEDTAPVRKRRRKQPSRKPARTPSKPVLPEVKVTPKRTLSNTSSNSNDSKQSTGSATRRSQRNKAPSTFPDDVEDLFGDMS